jgi:hypothetical protein
MTTEHLSGAVGGATLWRPAAYFFLVADHNFMETHE